MCLLTDSETCTHGPVCTFLCQWVHKCSSPVMWM